MKLKQFLGLQVFEFAYLMALAFLPFLVAQREVGLTILIVMSIYIIFSLLKFALTSRIDPTNEIVLITGCDTGFGNVLARRLDSLGFTVVAGCLDKSSEGAQLLKTETSGNLHVLQLDVTDDDSVNNCLSIIKKQFPVIVNNKGLWALVNNAGVISLGDVEFTSLESYQRVADVNLFGMIRMTKACLPLIRQRKGRIVNISGSAGRLSLPSMSAFSVSSFGIEAFSDALRLEMNKFGVKVVVVEPGNYYGSTGLLNRSGLANVQSEFDAQWEIAPKSLKMEYGKGYIDSQKKMTSELSKSAASSLAPVIDIIETAVVQISVRARYLVDGGNQLFDFANVLLHLKSWIPEKVMDIIVWQNYGHPVVLTNH